MRTQHILQNQLLKIFLTTPTPTVTSEPPPPRPHPHPPRNIFLMNSVGNIAINLKWQEGVCEGCVCNHSMFLHCDVIALTGWEVRRDLVHCWLQQRCRGHRHIGAPLNMPDSSSAIKGAEPCLMSQWHEEYMGGHQCEGLDILKKKLLLRAACALCSGGLPMDWGHWMYFILNNGQMSSESLRSHGKIPKKIALSAAES